MQGLNISLPDIVSDPTLTYKWAANHSGVEWVQSEDGNRALLFFPDNTLSPPLSLFIEANDVCGDSKCNSFPVAIDGAVVNTPSVIFNPPTNSLIVLDNTADSYQWGYENKSSLLGEVFPQGTYQDLIPSELSGHTFDPAANYYYVRLNYGGCVTKAYYNPPVLSPLQQVGSCEDVELVGSADLTEVNALRVFPNPNSGTYQIQWESPYLGPVTLSLFDAYGKAVHTAQAEKRVPAWQHRMQHANLPPGLYLLRLRTLNGKQLIRKILIQNR